MSWINEAVNELNRVDISKGGILILAILLFFGGCFAVYGNSVKDPYFLSLGTSVLGGTMTGFLLLFAKKRSRSR